MSDEYDLIFGNDAFAPKRERVNIDTGAIVQHGASTYRIVQILDFNSVIGMDLETGRSVPLRTGELRSIEDNALPSIDLADIADEDWQIAQKRFSAISSLVGKAAVGREAAEQRAKELNINVATLYRWLRKYNAYGTVTALIPQKRGWKQGNNKISKAAEDIIDQVIRDYYLTKQRPTPRKVVIEVLRLCHDRGVKPPSHMTIRARIAAVPEREQLRARGYLERAINRFTPTPGNFPNADYPLSVIQIDHTPADIILVDDVHRLPIGRPWITLAIDVHSRMVTGYYLSFDPPSETSVAMCVACSLLPKEEWLLQNNVDAQWPVWGIPRTIHVDNGADFRSNNFQQSCLAYGINLEFRPVKQPRYGGHIERLLGTLLKEIHTLPGTTFSSVKHRDGYDSEKHAVMTKSEFEIWLVTLICKVYHQRLHSSLGLTPLRQWEIGIFGGGSIQGVGLPPKPSDRLTVLLDFLPSFQRTVQTFGVMIDGLKYYAEALRPWVNSVDPETRDKRKLIFRRDPRDISCLWFFDPEIKQYFKIPFADQSLPSMSIWEFKQAKEKLKKEGAKSVNEHQVFQAITELRTQVDEAKEKSKKARRQAQRRKEHETKSSPVLPVGKSNDKPLNVPATQSDLTSDLIDGDIDTFGDIA
ncbi:MULTISPECIES: Mu transposase C-terminal domain-containing protein [Gynuella]|uniref:Integrase catalytic domain-containing protein n=1 Tax=Gynuella sunshinyii YC6258 TaxID=1445510 RepID=A0A0C5VCS7_9GAMM|nr:DDE-type integrase/transposase/recombinase [Gynuella sunshinyii]AJQ92277.1 hypothetical Protein YC6258_00225 [Gynuella sunshinyii YC6258]